MRKRFAVLALVAYATGLLAGLALQISPRDAVPHAGVSKVTLVEPLAR